MTQRTHPYTIFVNLWRVFYLVVFPVIRGFFSALRGGFADWLRGAWFDIVVLLFMVALATMQWWVQRYECVENGIHVRAGLLMRRDTFLRWNRIATASLSSPWILKPLRVSILRADALGGSYKNADINLYLGTRRAREILGEYREYNLPSPPFRRYEPKLTSVVALGMLASNSFAGILFLSTFISQSGRLLGNEFSEMLIDTFESLTRSLAVGIPPAAAAIGYLIIAGWLIAFVRTVLRYLDFHIVRRKRNLGIHGGRFTHRDYMVDYNHVNFIDIQQTIGTKILNLYSLYLSSVGYGKRKDDITCVLPAEPLGRFQDYRRLFFPRFQPVERQITPTKRGFLRFLSEPLYFCLGIPVVMVVTGYFMPSWRDFILFVGLMSLVPSLLFFVVRLVDYLTCGVGEQEGYYTLRYSSGFQLHTVVIPRDKIVKISLRQGMFQRVVGNCDLWVYTTAERRSAHHLRNFKLLEIREYFADRPL